MSLAHLFLKQFAAYQSNNHFENHQAMQGQTGFWSEKKIELRPGITLFIKLVDFREDHGESFRLYSNMASFWACFSGTERATIRGLKDDVLLSAGLCGTFVGRKGFKGHWEIPAKHPFHVVSIHMDPVTLNQVVRNEHDSLPEPYMNLVQGRDSGCFSHSMPMTPMIRVAAEQILNCSFEAGNRRLYFEGKALEIIACIMENFSTPSGPKPFFNTSDIERIHYARELLTRDFLNPPGLMDLARSVGMHHSKLNQGFKLLFGNTVFGHLTEMRLEEAKHYLESGDMNCAEAALSVGYSSLSHFAKAFNRQYGSNPSSYIKRISAPVRIRRFPMQGNCLKS